MTDDRALLGAVLEAPADEAPRLVYADWLEERGDPRGAFLRAEAAASRLPRDGPAFAAAERALRAQAAGLDAVWVARVSRPPVGACCDRVRLTGGGPPCRPPTSTRWRAGSGWSCRPSTGRSC